jgi:hypothetical protein
VKVVPRKGVNLSGLGGSGWFSGEGGVEPEWGAPAGVFSILECDGNTYSWKRKWGHRV